MEILIISGLSGAGKSKAASFLEDMGFYIVDNMPAAMILKFAEFCAGGNGRYDRVALVYDVRTASSFTELFDVLDKLKAMECPVPDAVSGGLAGGHHQALQGDPPPPSSGGQDRLPGGGGAARSGRMMAARQGAGGLCDRHLPHLHRPAASESCCASSAQRGGEGRHDGERHLLRLQVRPASWRRIWCLTCGSCRIPSISRTCGPGRGWTRTVAGLCVPASSRPRTTCSRLEDLLAFSLPLYAEEGKTSLTIAVGCTGGHHRSVAVTHALAGFIHGLGYQVTGEPPGHDPGRLSREAMQE